MYFSDIPAHEALKQQLGLLLAESRQPHAALYAGPEGSAALPLALAVASTLLCTSNKAGMACGSCASCQAVDKGTHPDLHFFFPSVRIGSTEGKQEALQAEYQQAWRKFLQSHPYGGGLRWRTWLQQSGSLASSAQKNLLISRDEVRRLLDAVALKPYMSKYSLVFIWAPERLHHIAANALLKTLEDPPACCLFLLSSHAAQKLSPVLRSRMQLFRVPPFSVEEISNYLQEKQQLPAEKATHIAQRSEGSLDQALHLCEVDTNIDDPLLQNWLRACWLQDPERLCSTSETFVDRSRLEQQSFLKESLYFFRQVLLQKTNCTHLAPPATEMEKFMHNFSEAISYKMIETFANACNTMLNHLEQHAHPKMLFLSHTLDLAHKFSEERRAAL